VDFDERGALLEEALDVIRTIWTTDDVTYEGRHFNAQGITAHPHPPSRPHPPIWIGGNTAAARRRVAEYGNGWCPFPAQGLLAQTARTDVLDSTAQLAEGIDDLRRRLDAAGRDPGSVDITFSNLSGGTPGTESFDAEAYLAGLEDLAKLGVNWVQVSVPGESLSGVLGALDQFRVQVIEPFSR